MDMLPTRAPFRAALARRVRAGGPLLLAEKVESQKVYRDAHGLGFGLFQGFFFERPTVVPGRDIPASRLHRIELLREIHKPGLDFAAIAEIIEREVGLSCKLMRYLNSAFFGWRGPVSSIHHALMLLGESDWAAVSALAARLAVDEGSVPDLYVEALEWLDEGAPFLAGNRAA